MVDVVFTLRSHWRRSHNPGTGQFIPGHCPSSSTGRRGAPWPSGSGPWAGLRNPWTMSTQRLRTAAGRSVNDLKVLLTFLATDRQSWMLWCSDTSSACWPRHCQTTKQRILCKISGILLNCVKTSKGITLRSWIVVTLITETLSSCPKHSKSLLVLAS